MFQDICTADKETYTTYDITIQLYNLRNWELIKAPFYSNMHVYI